MCKRGGVGAAGVPLLVEVGEVGVQGTTAVITPWFGQQIIGGLGGCVTADGFAVQAESSGDDVDRDAVAAHQVDRGVTVAGSRGQWALE